MTYCVWFKIILYSFEIFFLMPLGVKIKKSKYVNITYHTLWFGRLHFFTSFLLSVFIVTITLSMLYIGQDRRQYSYGSKELIFFTRFDILSLRFWLCSVLMPNQCRSVSTINSFFVKFYILHFLCTAKNRNERCIR